MSVIIRLQGLPWSASALDIRTFFRGLFIPQGGVHIIGGEKGDAFIAFSSDEDARQAMMRNTACLNGVSVQLFLSSKSEMQSIIDEARNRDVAGVAVAPAPVMPRTPTSGVAQEYQNQPYPVPQDMGNQRPSPQGNYQKPPDPNQGQYPSMQNQNQMQFHGQQMPDRTNQYGFQGDKQQTPYQQNVPPSKPKMGNEGQAPWTQGYESVSGKDNQQKQWNSGGYGATMEGGYESQTTDQWYQGGQELGDKQTYYRDNKGPGPGYQRNQPPEPYNAGPPGEAGQFQQQQQRRDQPYNPESPWQEGFSSGNRDVFPGMAEQPGPQDVNRRGVPPRLGQGNEPPAVPNAEHLPPRLDHMRFTGMGRPNVEQRPDMKMGQGGGRGHPPEGYPLQAMEEHRFPPNRREGPSARGGPQPGPFPDGPPKRGGILPTPDMANQDQQKDYTGDQFYNPEDLDQEPWPGQHREVPQSYEPGRGRGQFPPGREPNAKDAPSGRGRPFDGPESSRPRNRPRRSRFDQVDESPAERGPGERGFGSRPDERSTEQGPNRRPLPDQEHGLNRRTDDRPPRRGQDGPPFERGHDEWSGPDGRNQGRPFGGDSDSRPFDRGPNRRSLERGPGGPAGDLGMAFDRHENRDSAERGGERRPFKRGPDGRPKEGGLLGRAPDMRPFPGGPEGQTGEEHQGSFDKDRADPGRRFEGPHGRFDGPPGSRFQPTEEYDPADAEYNPEGHGDPGMRGPARRGFDDRGRGRGDRSERGNDRWNEEPRGGRGFDRGSSHGRGQGRRSFDHSEEEFGQYSEEGHFEDTMMEETHRDPFRNQHFPGGDMEQFNRGEGGPRPLGRPMRGRDRPYNRDMDRQLGGRGREEMDTHVRDRRREGEGRPASKGLLGDAPGDHPMPHFAGTQEKSPSLPRKEDDFHRDREARIHRSREDRERDDRSGRRSDHRYTRDRSPHRERRRERSRDRSEHRDRDRDRSSNRDSRDRGAEKSGRNDKKPEEQTKLTESKFILVKGFPPAYTTAEIQRFFYGCDLQFTGIRITKNALGQKTGEVYLEFPTVDQAKKAISKNGETIFGTPIALTFITKKDFDEKTKVSPSSTEKEKDPVKSPLPKDPKGTNIVMIKGLPPNIKREDLANLFSAVKLANTGKPLVIEYDDKKLATGIAYLATASQKDFETAVGYDGHILGSTALQLSAGDKKDMDACIAKQEEVTKKPEQPNVTLEKPPAGPGIMGARPPLMGVAPRMPGRPPLFGDKPPLHVGPDVPRNGPASVFEPGMNFPRPQQEERSPLKFAPDERPPRFHGPEERPARFHGPQDRPPRFHGPEDRPPRFHGPEDRPPRFHGPDERPSRFRGPEDRPPRYRGPGFCVQIQGLPMLATYNDLRAFFSGLNIAAHRGVQIVHDSNSKPTGEAFVEFETQEDKDEALKRDKTSLGSQIVAVKSVAKPDMIERLRNARLSSVGPAQEAPAPPHFPPRRSEVPHMSVPSHLLNPRLFYVACENFPQGITVPDIVEFFQDYNPVPDSIRQLYADDGTSTGNAVVGFFNREEAELALEELNGVLCGQSMVILQPVK